MTKNAGPRDHRVERNQRTQRRPAQPGIFRAGCDAAALAHKRHHLIDQESRIALPSRPQHRRMKRTVRQELLDAVVLCVVDAYNDQRRDYLLAD